MIIIIIVLLAVCVTAIVAFIVKQIELKKIQEDYELIIRQYKKMMELNHKKKALIGMASHDLSTPLASVDMWAQLLKSSEGNLNAEQKKSIDMICDASHYGQKLIRKIAELENVIPEKMSIEDFDFGALVVSVADCLKTSLKNNLRFDLNIEASVFLLSDKAMIKKMCVALFLNSIGNAKENSVMKVTLHDDDDEIIFKVKYDAVDNTKIKLFGLFSDYKQISSSKEESLEISDLSIVQRIVEELDAQMYSENDKYGNAIITIKIIK